MVRSKTVVSLLLALAVVSVGCGSSASQADQVESLTVQAAVPAEPTATLPALAPTRVADPAGCDVEYPDSAASPYRLPYASGTTYVTGLTNCTSSFHGPDQVEQLAYDFNMDIGGEVLAARGGEVTYVLTTDPNGSGSPGGNQVTIDHGDGTAGIYLHFAPDTVSVSVGDVVSQGDPIGASGFSGTNAGYPHLHFIVVEQPADYPWIGVPVVFSNAEPADGPLRPNTEYTATS